MTNRITPGLPPEQAEAVEWLNSHEGMQWSRSRHQQNSNMTWWFTLKRDQEGHASDEIQEGCRDYLEDVVVVDLGWYGRNGCYYRMRDEPRPGYVQYGKPVE